ncbi:MAG: hypothetical protein WC211_03535 [Dehalococcoidia bacterium]
MREHIERLHVDERETVVDEHAQVARERRGVAGDVDEAPRAGGEDRLDNRRLEAGAGRVDDDHVRRRLEAGEVILHAPDDAMHVVEAREVHLGVATGGGGPLDRHDLRDDRGEQRGEGADAGVRVDDDARTRLGDARDDEVGHALRLARVHLEERGRGDAEASAVQRLGVGLLAALNAA